MWTSKEIDARIEELANGDSNDDEIDGLLDIIRALQGERQQRVEITRSEADMLYGMLTQRLYLREDDPEREAVRSVRVKVDSLTTHYAELLQAANDLGIELPTDRGRAIGEELADTDEDTEATNEANR